ncbi:hypothetical protein [Luethyella okanaganae]|uniref:SbsA Ig-like domain-containing protein n=1 Tax=Luethyella okanaganae TaxID=69372 RepID=A0ABW1VF47_9MICO
MIGVFAVTCLVLTAVNVVNGPRMTGFAIDSRNVVSHANQRLVIDTNQPLAEIAPEQLTIVPDTPVTVQTQGDSIVVVFPRPLAYGTDYHVTFTDVIGISRDRPSTFAVDFHTDEPPLLYLARSPAEGGTKPADRIVRTHVGSPETTLAFQAPYIQSFVPLDDGELAVVTVNDNLSSTLSLVDPNGDAAALTLPSAGTVRELRSAPEQNLLGFRFSSAPGVPGRQYDNTLFLFDLKRGVANPVAGLDGSPLQAVNWGFMPGRAELVAQLYDTTLLLIDPLGSGSPIPLGQFPNLDAFAPDGLRIAVSDQNSQYVLDLSQGTENAIEPQLVDGTTPYTGELHFLSDGTGIVQRLAEFDTATGKVRQYLSLERDGESRILYEPASSNENVIGFAISPNDQYLAIRIIPNSDTQLSDGYPVDPQATTVTTLFIDIEAGVLRRSVVGFDVSW